VNVNQTLPPQLTGTTRGLRIFLGEEGHMTKINKETVGRSLTNSARKTDLKIFLSAAL